jgi:hypothetical protein
MPYLGIAALFAVISEAFVRKAVHEPILEYEMNERIHLQLRDDGQRMIMMFYQGRWKEQQSFGSLGI